MAGQFFPRKSAAHRTACIALYRALIAQCSRMPSSLLNSIPSQGRVNPVRYLVRRYFKRHCHDTSPRLVVAALKSGYFAERLLRSAGDGDDVAISQVQSLLLAWHDEREAARAACQRPLPRPTSNTSSRPARVRFSSCPGAPKVLDVRPLPAEQLKGRRSVPFLTLTSGFPLLRLKGRQSEFLGRVLRDRLEQKARRLALVEGLDHWVQLGMSEDEWDVQMRDLLKAEKRRSKDSSIGEKYAGKLLGNKDKQIHQRKDERGRRERESPFDESLTRGADTSWAEELAMARYAVAGLSMNEQTKRIETGQKMQQIVEKEQELWKEERQKRRDEKSAARLARKESRRLIEGKV